MTAPQTPAFDELPVLPRGGGTSLAGQCCYVAVVVDTSKYCNRAVEIDPERRFSMVEAGCVLDDLRAAAEHSGPARLSSVREADVLEFQVPEPGCCGMAGRFGFDAHGDDISMRRAERDPLPAVRQAVQDTLLIADGFSCREQIRQGSGREVLHLAEAVQLAMRH